MIYDSEAKTKVSSSVVFPQDWFLLLRSLCAAFFPLLAAYFISKISTQQLIQDFLGTPVFFVIPVSSERQERPKRNLRWSGLTVLIRMVCFRISQQRTTACEEDCQRLLWWNSSQIQCWRVYESMTTTGKVACEKRHNFTNLWLEYGNKFNANSSRKRKMRTKERTNHQ